MQLVMYVGNDFVASVPVNTRRLSEPGYVGSLKRQLINENNERHQHIKSNLEFLLVDVLQVNRKK